MPIYLGSEQIAAGGGGGGREIIDVQKFTSSGTWDKPDNAGLVGAYITGAGGGGYDSSNTGGAGGGEFCAHCFDAEKLSTQESVTVGSGGALKSDGGESSFAGISAAGGPFGGYQSSGGAGVNGGMPGQSGGVSGVFGLCDGAEMRAGGGGGALHNTGGAAGNCYSGGGNTGSNGGGAIPGSGGSGVNEGKRGEVVIITWGKV
jgi:hypothetical protein